MYEINIIPMSKDEKEIKVSEQNDTKYGDYN